jgi:hypothetical protein
MNEKPGRVFLYVVGVGAILLGAFGLLKVVALGAPASSLLVVAGAILNGIALVRAIRRIPSDGSS